MIIIHVIYNEIQSRERRIWHFRDVQFQNFPEHAPHTPPKTSSCLGPLMFVLLVLIS